MHRAVQAPCNATYPLPSLDVVRALLEAGADVHARDANGVTPAGRAVVSNNFAPTGATEWSVEVLALLVEHGARLDGPFGYVTGGSFAHTSWTAPEVYAFLLEHGAPTDLADERGDTPLHATVDARRPLLVDMLLRRGVDTTAVNLLGQTPLGVALDLPQRHEENRRSRSRIIALLEAEGAPARVPYPLTEGGPLPIDMHAIRRAAAELRAEGNDDSSLRRFVEQERTYDSYQHFTSALYRDSGSEGFSWLVELSRRALDGTKTTRTIVGERELCILFFHHGDLVIKGNMRVICPFVVTGSLTVEGCLMDEGPESRIAIGGDLKARAVYTDGDLHVGGDIEADIVYGYYNDHVLEAGTIRSRLVIEDDHLFDTCVEAEHHFDMDTYKRGHGEGVQERLRALLMDEVFTKDGDEDEQLLDHRTLFSHLWEGRPVFRTAEST